jgi:hypothetical protein
MARAAVTTKPVLDAGLSFSDHMTTESMPPWRRWLRNPKGRVTAPRSARRRRAPIGCGSPTIARLGPEVTPVTAGVLCGVSGLRGRSQPGSVARERERPQRAHGRGDHLRCLRRRARPALGGCGRPGRRRRRAQGAGSGPVTQPVSGRCPRSCGVSKNTVCRSWSWQLVHATRTCPMPRPRPAAPAGRPAEARRPAQLRLARPQL